MFLLPDEEFGAHRARIILTPMFSRVTTENRSLALWSLFVRALALIFLLPGAYRATFKAWCEMAPGAKVLTRQRRRAMYMQAIQLPPATHVRLGEATATAVPERMEPLRRTWFALGVNDPETTPDDCARACRALGIRPERFRWFASGAHCPHIETSRNPEGTFRNRHELVLLVDEALDDVSPMRTHLTEFAETQASTGPTTGQTDGPSVASRTGDREE
jgi:hypothetical protein